MRIGDLISNMEFSFNASFRIYEYIPPEFDSNEEGECMLKYDSESDMDYDTFLDGQEISAINQDEDGTIAIEYMEYIL